MALLRQRALMRQMSYFMLLSSSFIITINWQYRWYDCKWTLKPWLFRSNSKSCTLVSTSHWKNISIWILMNATAKLLIYIYICIYVYIYIYMYIYVYIYMHMCMCISFGKSLWLWKDSSKLQTDIPIYHHRIIQDIPSMISSKAATIEGYYFEYTCIMWDYKDSLIINSIII